MGGDEFMLILPEVAGVKDVAKTAKKILEAVREPFVLDDHELHITTSIGIALYPYDGEDADTLMRNADIAMYQAKEKGRDNTQRYTAAMNAKASG
jgi:diguanylate cyclase (GGDEF)-like protein